MRLGIQILNYNGMTWLPGLLDSLAASELGDHKIYLVDNNSTDGSLQYVEQHWPGIQILRNRANLGYSAAYNHAVPSAFNDGCDWVVLMNTDVLVEPGWLTPLRQVAEQPGVGVMGPAFLDWSGSELSHFMRLRYPQVNQSPGLKTLPQSTSFEVDWIEGSVMLIRRECFEQLGGLDVMYFMYWEDADFCRRARYQGWKVLLVPASLSRHYGGGVTTETRFNQMKARNHMIYLLTDPERTFFINFARSLRLAATYLSQALFGRRSISQGCLVITSVAQMVARLPQAYARWRCSRAALPG